MLSRTSGTIDISIALMVSCDVDDQFVSWQPAVVLWRKPLGPSQPDVEITAIGFNGVDVLKRFHPAQLDAIKSEVNRRLEEERHNPGA